MKKYAVAISLVLSLVFVLGIFGASAQGKKEVEAEGIDFDPRTFTVEQFMAEISPEEGNEGSGQFYTAVLWMHGYVAKGVGAETFGAITSESFDRLMSFVMFYADENVKANMVDVAEAYTKMLQK